jgi:hypothetical protein
MHLCEKSLIAETGRHAMAGGEVATKVDVITVAEYLSRLQSGRVAIPPFSRPARLSREFAERYVRGVMRGTGLLSAIVLGRAGRRERYLVIDGMHRTLALKTFADGQLAVDGKTVEDPETRERFLSSRLLVVEVTAGSYGELFELFRLVNENAVRATRADAFYAERAFDERASAVSALAMRLAELHFMRPHALALYLSCRAVTSALLLSPRWQCADRLLSVDESSAVFLVRLLMGVITPSSGLRVVYRMFSHPRLRLLTALARAWRKGYRAPQHPPVPPRELAALAILAHMSPSGVVDVRSARAALLRVAAAAGMVPLCRYVDSATLDCGGVALKRWQVDRSVYLDGSGRRCRVVGKVGKMHAVECGDGPVAELEALADGLVQSGACARREGAPDLGCDPVAARAALRRYIAEDGRLPPLLKTAVAAAGAPQAVSASLA